MFNRAARRLLTAVVSLACAALPAPSHAQEVDRTGETGERPAAEAEFTASSIFQAGYFDARVGGTPLLLDLRYYGVEVHDVGVGGLAWELAFRRLRFMPGVGWAMGRENKPAPVLTARWFYDHDHWLSQGHWLQSFHEHVTDTAGERAHESDGHAADDEEADAKVRSVVLEGHVSAVLGRFELGALGEHVRYREENEWKGGGRAGWRLGHGVTVSTEVLAPHVEVRGGIAWEP